MRGEPGLAPTPPPSYLTRFVGREQEAAALRLLISPAGGVSAPDSSSRRLITLCGPGGSGKTRLALEVVTSLGADDEHVGPCPVDAVHWVALGSITQPSQVGRAVAAAFGGAVAMTVDPMKGVIRAMYGHPALLVLDTCEHLVDGCRDLVAALLQACPWLVVVATSRTPLGLTDETVFPVPPLRSSSAGSDAMPTQGSLSEAEQLFLDRAALGSGRGATAGVAADAIGMICRRLDGSPLAIELAASWMRVLTPDDLLAELDRGMTILSSSLPNLDERHRSMNAVLQSSWQRLTDEDRAVLGGLSVFAGNFSREAAEAVAGAVLSSLSSLAEKSLIQRLPSFASETRYHIHELVRQHALERLAADDPEQGNRLRRAHLDYVVAMVERAQQAWDTPDEDVWLERLRTDQANVDAALLWALDHVYTEQALRLAAGLFAFWIYTSSPALYRVPLERALALPWDETSPTTMRARARALNVAGYATASVSDHRAAFLRFDEALALYSRLGDENLCAWVLRGRSFTARLAGKLDESHEDEMRSLEICRRTGDGPGESWSVFDLGEIAYCRSDLDQAEKLVGQGLGLFEERGIWFGAYRALVVLGDVDARRARWPQAIRHYEEALVRQRRSRFVARGAEILEGLAGVAAALQEWVTAARLLGAAQEWRSTFKFTRDLPHRRDVERAETSVRRGLTAAAWSAHYEAGRRLTSGVALEEAEQRCSELIDIWTARDAHLTQRQHEVLHALASGLSNAEIAAQLVLSTRTVDAHLRCIFDKLGVSSRTAAARRAAELHLI